MGDTDKRYILFAGVNGSGKSTLYYLHPELQDTLRVNLDEIAREIGSWKDTSILIEAGKRTVRLKNRYLEEGVTFNQETTLCGHDPINTIRKAKALGYYVEMHYIGVDSADICIQRIRKRVVEGGHGVPDDIVRRRYGNSFINLQIALPLCDKTFFYDNTERIKLFCIYDRQGWQMLTDEIPEWFRKNVLSGGQR